MANTGHYVHLDALTSCNTVHSLWQKQVPLWHIPRPVQLRGHALVARSTHPASTCKSNQWNKHHYRNTSSGIFFDNHTFMIIIAFANTVITTSIVRAFVQARFSLHAVPVKPGAQLHFPSSHVPRPPHLFGQHFNGATPLAGHVSFEQSSPSRPCTHSQHFFYLPWPEQPLGQTFTAQVLPVNRRRI